LFECHISKQAWLASGLQHIVVPWRDNLQRCFGFYGTIATIPFGTTQKGRGINWALELYVYMWNDWWTVQEVRNQQNTGEVQSVSRHKPEMGWYKCNVDVGFHKNMRKIGVG
jgi:hypothetical protein